MYGIIRVSNYPMTQITSYTKINASTVPFAKEKSHIESAAYANKQVRKCRNKESRCVLVFFSYLFDKKRKSDLNTKIKKQLTT